MTPEISRRLGRILGLHGVSVEERERIIVAAEDATSWSSIPRGIRDLLAEIGRRGAVPPQGGRSGSTRSPAAVSDLRVRAAPYLKSRD